MARNQIVINVDIGETRVALIENGIVTELHIERRGERSNVGDVYLGRVTRVLPGMNAAFVDIGLERAAFLHSEDVVNESDLRASSHDHDDEVETRGSHTPLVSDARDESEERPIVSDAESEASESSEGSDEEGDGEEGESEEGDELPLDEEGGTSVGDMLADSGDGATVEGKKPEGAPGASGQRGPGGGNRDRRGNQGGNRDPRGGGRRRDGKKGGRGPQGGPRSAHARDPRGGNGGASAEGGRSNGGNGGGDRGGNRERAPKTPIKELLREGQEIVVQVSKDPISTKGARCTSHISLAGRYAVYLPTVDHVGVSKRIGSEKERRRLREVIDQLKPEKGGIIVRTASEGLTKKQLKTDVGYLVTLWADIWRKRSEAKGATLLYSELDVVLRTVRDVMGPEIEKVIIDDRESHARCVRFVERFMPDRKDDIVLYNGEEPVFDAYGIEDEISRALARKVPLRSGGYLIIDQAEALTAIDVNSGRFVGKGNKDVEDTVTQTNLEAVQEIAYQLRLRNLGGLIILDLIDMDRQGNREKVYRALSESLKQDKAKTSILRISELGLIEMTRKRTRESLGRQLYEPCFYCDGTGHTSSRLTIAYEVLRQIRRERDGLKGFTIVVQAHPAVADAMKHEAREAFEEAQKRYQRRIVVTPKPEYHIEQFDLAGQ